MSRCIAKKCEEEATHFVMIDKVKHPLSENLELCQKHEERYRLLTINQELSHDKARKALTR